MYVTLKSSNIFFPLSYQQDPPSSKDSGRNKKKTPKSLKTLKNSTKKKNSKVLEFLLNFLPNDCTFTKTPNTHFCEMEVS